MKIANFLLPSVFCAASDYSGMYTQRFRNTYFFNQFRVIIGTVSVPRVSNNHQSTLKMIWQIESTIGMFFAQLTMIVRPRGTYSLMAVSKWFPGIRRLKSPAVI